MRIALVLLSAFLGPALVAGQSPAPATADQRPQFEAASVKPNNSPDAGINNRFSPGRFAYVNTPLDTFISTAYRFPLDRVIGMPDWARREKFDITATHSPQYTSFSEQQLAMLQRLLEDRFSLQTHRETREMPVYELVKVRADGLGPQLRVSSIDCLSATADKSQCGTRINSGIIEGQFVRWQAVVAQLPSAVARAVIDKTGLNGMFELKLEWNPNPAATAAAAPGERVDIFTALQEQLGVKLQPARAPLEVLVIDRLERPTPD